MIYLLVMSNLPTEVLRQWTQMFTCNWPDNVFTLFCPQLSQPIWIIYWPCPTDSEFKVSLDIGHTTVLHWRAVWPWLWTCWPHSQEVPFTRHYQSSYQIWGTYDIVFSSYHSDKPWSTYKPKDMSKAINIMQALQRWGQNNNITKKVTHDYNKNITLSISVKKNTTRTILIFSFPSITPET